MSDPQLSPRDLALVDAVAERVLELLAERGALPPRSPLVSAAELAEILGVSREYIYEHSAELGARPVGDGPRPRLRFDVEEALEAATRRDASGRSQTPGSPVPAGRPDHADGAVAGSEVPLLPVRGRNGRRQTTNR